MKLASAAVAALAMVALVLTVVAPGAAAVQLRAQAREDANAALEEGEGGAGRAEPLPPPLQCGDPCPSLSAPCACSTCGTGSVPKCLDGGVFFLLRVRILGCGQLVA